MSGLVLLFIVFSIVVEINFYDTSWDGQSYHQDAIINMAHGWNPLEKSLDESDTLNHIWVNHYPKSVEIIQTCFYLLFNRLETGKALNIIFIIISYILCVYTLGRLYPELNIRIIHLISFFLAFNPVSICQVFTFCIDGILSSLLLCLIMTGTLLYLEIKGKHIILFSSVLIILINSKLTATPYTGIIIIGFIFLLMLEKRRKDAFIFSIISGTVSLFSWTVIGFNPFIQNFLEHRHPFWPAMGKDKIDLILTSIPANWVNMNRFEKLFHSIFSETKNTSMPDVSHLKIPFTIGRGEWNSFRYADLRVGGFGYLFGGIVIVVGVLLVYYLLKKAYKDRLYYYNLVLALFIFISAVINPECWWARYVPQLWFLIILLFVWVISSEINKKVQTITMSIVSINLILIFSIVLSSNIKMTSRITAQMSQLKNKKVFIYHSRECPFISNEIRLRENGIDFSVIKDPEAMDTNYKKAIMPGSTSVLYFR